MHEIGKKLRAARKAKKFTITSLAERTKINPQYLQNIEAGNWDFLPEPYIQGIVRKFAKQVGVDADELLKQYSVLEVEKLKNDARRSAEKAEKLKKVRSRMNLFSRFRMLFLSLTGLILLIIILLLLICSSANSSDYSPVFTPISEIVKFKDKISCEFIFDFNK